MIETTKEFGDVKQLAEKAQMPLKEALAKVQGVVQSSELRVERKRNEVRSSE